jgi:glycolate oxidase FAD binding subunit
MPTLDAVHLQLRDRIAAALAQGHTLRLRGGGSKDFVSGAGANAEESVLDTRVLNGIISYEPSELVVTVRSGTSLLELEALLREKNQYLPFEPPHYTWSAADAQATSQATVGGMVACGYSGPARAAVGGVRDFVLGVGLFNGRGHYLRFGGQVMKNVAGYDVSRLMVGAWGTLGLITEVSLKVMPVPPAEASVRFDLPQHTALEQLHTWGAQALPLNASCWLQEQPGPHPGRESLYVRLRGAAAAVDAACRRMLQDQTGQRLDAAQSAALWTPCRNQHLPFFTQPPQADGVLWRISVPATTPVLDLPRPTLVEWQGALRWVWAPADVDVPALARSHGGSAMIFIAQQAINTTARGQFGTKNPISGQFSGSADAQGYIARNRIAQRIKASFDPAGIFNI